MRAKKQPFIFRLNKQPDIKYYHCPTHQGARLLPYYGEESLYQCPLGCSPINVNEVKADTKITSRFAVSQGKQIAAGHNRSYKENSLHKQINPNDKDILQDIAQGHSIQFYHTTEDINLKQKESKYLVRR